VDLVDAEIRAQLAILKKKLILMKNLLYAVICTSVTHFWVPMRYMNYLI
jgi:hypothetical protein